jgi:hypothetical protein
MELRDIVELIENHGINGTLVIIVIFIFATTFKIDWITKFLSKISSKFIEIFIKSGKNSLDAVRDIKDSDIGNHDIFTYIDFWDQSKIPTLQFSSEYRSIIFRRYLSIYLRSYRRNIKKYVESKEYQKMDQGSLSNSFLFLINNIIHEYERISEESGIPRVVIDKMKVRNSDTINLKIDLINSVCNSQFYSSEKNLLKVYSILNILLSVLENTISGSEDVCNSINGQLKGLKVIVDGREIEE